MGNAKWLALNSLNRYTTAEPHLPLIIDMGIFGFHFFVLRSVKEWFGAANHSFEFNGLSRFNKGASRGEQSRCYKCFSRLRQTSVSFDANDKA